MNVLLKILMDFDLSYDDHGYDKISVANRMLGLIKRNFINLKSSFILLYRSMVRCHLEFVGSVWSPYKKALIRDIEGVQKPATKVLHKCTKLSYVDTLTLLHLPTLNYRRFRGDMIEVSKILNGFY